GSLVSNVHLELLYALYRRWHNTRGSTSGRGRSKAWSVGIHSAIHVAAVVTAVELEGILVADSTGYRAVRGDGRLQCQQGRDVTAKIWEFLQILKSNRRAHGSVQRLQCRTRGLNHNLLGSRSDLKRRINCELSAEAYLLFCEPCLSKASFIY